jgi:hypothetical protein
MEYAILTFLVINSILLIGIAGSLTKIIKYLQSTNVQKDEWVRIMRSKKNNSDAIKNYVDTQENINWDGIPIGKNWDGVS